jgi:hypothetical protein
VKPFSDVTWSNGLTDNSLLQYIYFSDHIILDLPKYARFDALTVMTVQSDIVTNVSEESTASFFSIQDGGSRFLRIFDNFQTTRHRIPQGINLPT